MFVKQSSGITLHCNSNAQKETLQLHSKYKSVIAIIPTAYTSELNRGSEKKTFFSSILRHTAEINTIANNNLCPYADPFLNLYATKELKKVTEVFSNQWKQKLQASTKVDTYRTFKMNMRYETYLSHPRKRERIAMTKLRISDHKLMVEKGRHSYPIIRREDRKCHMCTAEVENEVHFLTNCKIYGSQNDFWNQVTTKFPQTLNLRREDRLVFILTQDDPEIMGLLLKLNYEWQRLNSFLCEYFYDKKTDQTITFSQGMFAASPLRSSPQPKKPLKISDMTPHLSHALFVSLPLFFLVEFGFCVDNTQKV